VVEAADDPPRLARGPSLFLFIASVLMIAIAAMVYGAWPSISRTVLRSSEEQAVQAWIDQNEGDPSSVEIIHLEGPRYWGGDEWLKVKYRATSPLGGPVVKTEALMIENGDARLSSQRGEVVCRLWE